MAETVSFEQVRDALKEGASALIERKQHFNDLDSQIGDSDHGDTIAYTFEKVLQTLESYNGDGRDVGDLLKKIGRGVTLSSGAAMGPLYGAGFTEAGKAVAGESDLGLDRLVELWTAFASGIEKRGGVERGEKTMYDAVMPSVDAVKRALSEGASIGEACERAIEAAREGMESTKELESRRGRSSRLGKRSVGHIDPGAASMFEFISAFFSQFA